MVISNHFFHDLNLFCIPFLWAILIWSALQAIALEVKQKSQNLVNLTKPLNSIYCEPFSLSSSIRE